MHLGIDLGTTNSLAALFRNGQTELVPNAIGHFLTPSAVSVDEQGEVLVGLPARERMSIHPEHTATAFKRWMGTDRVLKLGKRVFRPEELSALVLRSLKADAEAHAQCHFDEAVITVPAYFNQAQRKATQDAALLAGLRVERLLNEPTAAGLAYGLQERNDHSTFLIFDLGGGTFDVSVLEYFEGIVQVRASAGDTRLGGEDFVRALQQLFLSRCEGLKDRERHNLLDSGVLWRAAEQAKRDLSDQAQTEMRVIHRDQELIQTITRADFEQASTELLLRLRRPIERALLDSRLQPNELDEVVLVGGATRMPVVRQTVARLFQRLPLRTINPDETIARGAAIQAGLKARDAALEEIVLTDVMPYSLGIVTSDSQQVTDRFSPIIERNTPVPVSRMGIYCTVQDKQNVVRLDVRQGESPIGSENLYLGDLEVRVPPMKAGEANVEVRFSYDANGLLEVDAVSLRDGVRVNKLIQQNSSQLDAEQLAQALQRLQALKIHPRELQENRYLLERTKRLYEDRLGNEREMLQAWLSRFEQALDTQDASVAAQAREELQGALDQIDRGFVY